ncbi:Phosphatidylglycerol/phosphatidylinositol transfer protein [Pichia californica]|uniref:Phosphatidylglycerol/phosphatidylinositol transfer protein n=1 Tax=Pichia californica TaxID=460514 RepID=A0A9P6WKD7_9ASCO|nr:Phosphatidylglycerol/phosphatidylinositol transfer protein [[Candida] californica]KAG0688587.1 Phosphatidylglycerol/phosphatidylinositol transfer protein [[Candida] californica]
MVSLSFLPFVTSLLPFTKPIPGNSPIEQCDISSKQSLKLYSVDLSPNPPERGQNLTITASGFLSDDIEQGAYVDVVVNYGYIKLLTQTYDLCDELPNIDMTCPINNGDYTLTKIVQIPNEVPPGKYTVFARAYNKDDSMISCLTGTVEFPQLL